MSESGKPKTALELPKFDELESAVVRALRQLEVWRERAAASESERRRVQEVIDGVRTVSDEMNPAELMAELERLRAENDALRQRLKEGKQQAERLASEVEFLEDTR